MIEPVSTPVLEGGTNSEPMKPAGTSAMDPTTSSAHTTGTRIRLRRAQGSTTEWYQRASFSKSVWNHCAQTGTAGLRRFTDQRPASNGVSVNDTSSEKSVATTMTKPNSRMYWPMMPVKNAIGVKTTTSTKVIVIAALPISVRPK